MPKFGDAKVGEENVTLLSPDFVTMEHPEDQLNESAEDNTFAKSLVNFINKQAETKLVRDLDMDIETEFDRSVTIEADSSAPKVEKYVAPGSRGAGATSAAASSSTSDKEGEATLRVSNLSKSANEDDLRDLFERFGKILRVYLPRVEEKTLITERGEKKEIVEKVPRGFAYIAFLKREDAELAMNRLQGHGYDHLILKIEWARPTTKDPFTSSSGMGSSFYSGYGQKLAQDTTEKAVFTSTRS